MTNLVVDIGCADHHGRSVDYLVKRFRPSELYGFDPWPDMEAGVYRVRATDVHLSKEAAWTHDGEISYMLDGDCSHVGEGDLTVPCFDLADWLSSRPAGTVLKIDAEGAEYELIPRLIETGEDKRLKRLLIEWHHDDHGLTEQLGCRVEVWPF